MRPGGTDLLLEDLPFDTAGDEQDFLRLDPLLLGVFLIWLFVAVAEFADFGAQLVIVLLQVLVLRLQFKYFG